MSSKYFLFGKKGFAAKPLFSQGFFSTEKKASFREAKSFLSQGFLSLERKALRHQAHFSQGFLS